MPVTVLHVGSAETVTVTARDQILALRELGWQPIVACAPEHFVENLEEDGIPWVSLDIPSRPDPLQLVARSGTLARIIVKERVGLVHTHNAHHGLVGRVLARILGVPSVHTWRYNPVDAADGALERLVFGALEAVASRSGQAVLFQNGDDFRFAVRHRIVPKARARFVGNGIELSRHAHAATPPAEVRASLGVPDGAPMILCVGRLAERKRQADLIAALAELECRDAVLVLVGIGPDKEELETTAGHFHVSDRVFFAGERRDVTSILKAADVFCLASRREGVPRAVMEAMVCGIPVVGTDVVGTREVIKHERTGLLVPFSDPSALARAVDRLLQDRTLGSRLADEAETVVRRSWDQTLYVQRTDSAYRDVILAGTRRFSRLARVMTCVS